MYTQRTGSMSLEGFWLVDAITGQRDPGQLKCDQAATKVGYEAYRYFKVKAYTVSGGEIGNFYFLGQAAQGDMGGSVTDVEPWAVDLVFEGRPVGSGVFSFFNP